jgi:hypothetical protein
MLSVLNTWFGGKKPSQSRRRSRPSVRPTLESLDGRFLPSTLTVLNTSDFAAGPSDVGVVAPGSLRSAVNTACADAQRGVSDTFVFARSLQGATIKLQESL